MADRPREKDGAVPSGGATPSSLHHSGYRRTWPERSSAGVQAARPGSIRSATRDTARWSARRSRAVTSIGDPSGSVGVARPRRRPFRGLAKAPRRSPSPSRRRLHVSFDTAATAAMRTSGKPRISSRRTAAGAARISLRPSSPCGSDRAGVCHAIGISPLPGDPRATGIPGRSFLTSRVGRF